MNKKIKYYEQQNLQLNITKAQKKLKWQPNYTISKSISVTVDWYKKVLIEKKSPEEVTELQIKNFFEC